MRGTRIFISSLLLASASLLAADVPDYLPLQVGNQWVYRATGATVRDPVTIEVLRSAVYSGQTYFQVQVFFGGKVWLRNAGEGTLVGFDPDSQREYPWLSFGAADGTPFPTQANRCNQQAVIRSRAADYEGPVGTFHNALALQYPAPSCADAGLSSELYLPYIGMLQRITTSIAGPVTYDLTYAKLGDLVFVAEPHLSFGLTIDRNTYFLPLPANKVPSPALPAPTLVARLTLRNTRPEAITLGFASGQTYDLVVRNQEGTLVARWSQGQVFTQALRREEFGPGERNYVLALPLTDGQGRSLPPGYYTAEGFLTMGADHQFSASVGFRIAASIATTNGTAK